MSIPLIGLDKLLNHRGQSIHVFLELPIDVVDLQFQQFGQKELPVLEGASQVSVLDAASSHSSLIVEVFFEAVHDNRSGEGLLEKATGAKIAFQILSYTLVGIFSDGHDDSFEELGPIALVHASGVDCKFLLALMADEGPAQLFGVVVDIFGEPEHDDEPEVIWFNHYIAVVHVGLVETVEKSVGGRVGELAVLGIGQKLPVLSPELGTLQIGHWLGLLSFEVLDGDGPIAFVKGLTSEFWLFALFPLFLGKLFPQFFEIAHNQYNFFYCLDTNI